MNNSHTVNKQSIYARNGVVATSERLASKAGLEILRQGGNAVDAAVAAAATLTVVEPTSNGIGSDCFAIVYFNNKLHGLNSSGYSSRNISIEKIKKLGYNEIPAYGIIPITIPGTPKGWAALINKFGNLSLLEVLSPAIKLAEEGFIIGETVGYYFERAIEVYKKKNIGNQYNQFYNVFTKNGAAYKAGDFFKSQEHANTLRSIGETNSDSFYKGEIANKIVSFMKKYDGYIDKSDLAEFESEFVDPISVNYKGYNIFEIPPNGQGITALMALNLLKDESFKENDIITYHKQIEAIKIAFSDTLKYVTDPQFMKMNKDFLISDEYLKLRKKDIGEKAKIHQPIDYKKSGTVYLATADKDGNMVSFIQSNYMGFGSGIMIDNTGIAMQNRGHTFSLDEEHHNKLEPRKRTLHTIIPGFIMKDDKVVGPFGVMGGFMQPQGHLQVVMNMIDFKLDPQTALDAPRFRWDKGLNVAVENTFDKKIIKQLEELGHHITIEEQSGGFGRGQIIIKDKDRYKAGTEIRCDGFIAYY